MTPEQERTLQELEAQIAAERARIEGYAARELVPDAPAPTEPVPTRSAARALTAPIPTAGAPMPIAIRPPVTSAPQTTPMPITRPIPEREVRRPGSRAGRRAHKAFGAILAPFTGRNSYLDRVAREDALADQRYRDDLLYYQLQKQQDAETYQASQDAAPVPEHLVSQYGLPIGTTWGQLKKYQQMGYGSLVRQREGAEASDALEAQRQQGRLGLEDEKQDNRIALEQLRQQGRKKLRRGGGGGRGAQSLVQRIGTLSGLDAAEVQEGLEDLNKGSFTTPAARSLLLASQDKNVKRVLDTYLKTGNVERRDIEASEGDLQKYYTESADVRSGLASWNRFLAANGDNVAQYVDEVKADPTGKSWSTGARNMMNEVRKPIASFLRKMAGAAMSPSEARLHGGEAAALLVDSGGDSWVSLDGLSSRLEKYLSRTNARPEDLFALIDRVNREADEAFKAKVRAAPTAALSAVPTDERRKVLQDRLQEAASAGKLQVPKGGKIAPSSIRLDGHRIRFDVIMPDGSTQKGAVSE